MCRKLSCIHSQQIIVMWGNVTRSLVVNFEMWHTLTARFRFSPPSIIKIHVFLKFEIKRNSLKNTQPMCIVFISCYFGD